MIKKILLSIILIILFYLNFCTVNGLAREQIKNEISIISDELYVNIYKLYYEKKYLETYNQLYNYAFNKKGKSLIMHSLLVNCAFKLNQTEILFKSYKNYEDQRFYLFAQGVLLIIEERRKEETINIFKEILYFFPENPIVQMYLGYAYIINNKPYLAEEILNKSIENLPNFPFNLFFLAMANYFTNNKNKALENIDNALKFFHDFMKEDIEAAKNFKKKIQQL